MVLGYMLTQEICLLMITAGVQPNDALSSIQDTAIRCHVIWAPESQAAAHAGDMASNASDVSLPPYVGTGGICS